MIGRPCLDCGAPTTGASRCPQHTDRTRRQPWRAGYDTPEYRANREQALQRDGWRCVRCGRGIADGVRVEVDHVIALSSGGGNDIDNLQVMCEMHHRDKTQERP